MSPQDFKDLGIGLAALAVLGITIRYGYLGTIGFMKIIGSFVDNVKASTKAMEATTDSIRMVEEAMRIAHKDMGAVSARRDEQFHKLQTSIDALPTELRDVIIKRLDEAFQEMNGSIKEMVITLKDLLQVQIGRSEADAVTRAEDKEESDKRIEVLEKHVKANEEEKEGKDGPES